MLGRVSPGVLHLDVVARFPNDPVRTPDGLHWSYLELYARAVDGLRTAVRVDGDLTGVAVDSWAVDYGLIQDGRLLGVPYHYRDEARGKGVMQVHAMVPQEELYRRTGLQFLPFNTVYQLAADPWVSRADHLLLIPDLMNFMFTGRLATERTNASTTGLLDVHTGGWDEGLIRRLRLPREVFGDLVDPGEVCGPLLPHVADSVGSRNLTVSAVGSHDTASAVVAVPIQTDDAAYISCGTWGLVGFELDTPVVTEASRTANFTNEGGVDGRIRFLTNVMGTWLLSESMRTWERQGHGETLPTLLAAARDASRDAPIFDVQYSRFVAPEDMPARIAEWFEERRARRRASGRPSSGASWRVWRRRSRRRWTVPPTCRAVQCGRSTSSAAERSTTFSARRWRTAPAAGDWLVRSRQRLSGTC